jgi:hypothetical protein
MDIDSIPVTETPSDLDASKIIVTGVAPMVRKPDGTVGDVTYAGAYVIRTGRMLHAEYTHHPEIASYDQFPDSWDASAAERNALLRTAALNAVRTAVHKAISTGVAE